MQAKRFIFVEKLVNQILEAAKTLTPRPEWDVEWDELRCDEVLYAQNEDGLKFWFISIEGGQGFSIENHVGNELRKIGIESRVSIGW